MMMSVTPQRHYTLEEYLALERESEIKYEFWHGEIFAMSGGTLGHNLVMDNVAACLRLALQGKPCRVFSSNSQIKVPMAPPYRYADGSVVCGTIAVERFNGNDLLCNPVLIYEVLSPSTEGFDRGDKFTYYKSIPSLAEYLLIAQHRPHITQYVKQPDGSWAYTEVNGLEKSLYLPSLGVTLHLSDVYQDVAFAS
jgi:Uma2 family endonuclease